jgi:hypothetical protein
MKSRNSKREYSYLPFLVCRSWSGFPFPAIGAE